MTRGGTPTEILANKPRARARFGRRVFLDLDKILEPTFENSKSNVRLVFVMCWWDH